MASAGNGITDVIRGAYMIMVGFVICAVQLGGICHFLFLLEDIKICSIIRFKSLKNLTLVSIESRKVLGANT